MIHQHSREAYPTVSPTQGQRIYHALKEHGAMTREELAEHLEIRHTSACGRVRELLDQGAIQEVGVKRVNGRSQAIVGVLGE